MRELTGMNYGTIKVIVFASLLLIGLFGLIKSLLSTPNISTYLDHQTGCSYLISPNGSLTPRLDTDGLPICDEVMILDTGISKEE